MDLAQKQAAAKRYLLSKTLFAQLGSRYLCAPENHVQQLPPTTLDKWRAARVLARELAAAKAKPAPVAVLKRAASK